MPIPQNTQPIPKPLIREQVYEDLRQWIVDGTLRPGENLKDIQLASRLGISRTPVREALRRLEDEGLVHTSANRWTRVSEIQMEEIDQILPIMNSLELLSLTQAFIDMGPEDIEKMREANRKLEEAVQAGNYAEAAEANRKFHYVFILRTENTELIRVIQRLRVKIQRLGSYYFSSPTLPSSSIREHAELIQAISAKRLEDAKTILSGHWDNVTRRLREAAQKNES